MNTLNIPIIGLPNVGKSTLVNALVGEKVSIVTNKPHTTRRIHTFQKQFDNLEMCFVDTPGIKKTNSKLGKIIFKNMQSYLLSLEKMILVLDCTDPHLYLFENFIHKSIVILNKVDTLRKPKLLPLLNAIAQFNPLRVFCVCARTGEGIQEVLNYLKEESCLEETCENIVQKDFDADQILAYACECVREKILLIFSKEIPYNIVVQIREAAVFKESAWRIFIDIIVPKPAYKPILIGNKGINLKKIGEMVRLELACKIKQPGFLGLNIVVDEKLWKKDSTYLGLGWKI